MLADKYGPRVILAAIVSFWSLFTALTGTIWNFISLLFVRFFFGVGEAGAYPAISRAVFNWIPLSERGLVTGINFSGSRLGAAFALPLVAWLISNQGWRNSFLILGLAGIVWAILWWISFRNKPEEHNLVSEEEKRLILMTRQQVSIQESQAALSLGKMFRSKNMTLLMIQYFCSNFTFFFALTWLYPHIKDTYELNSVEAGWYTSIPLICGAFGNWFSGWWVDYLYQKKSWKKSRQYPAMLGFFLSAMGLIASVYVSTVFGAIFFLSLAIFGADMILAPSWAVCVDVGKQHSGAVSGTMNMAGNIGSFITSLAFPYLKVWSGSVIPFFFVGAGLNLIAVLLWRKIDPEKSLEEY